MWTLALAVCVGISGAVKCTPRDDFEVVGVHDQRTHLSDFADRDIVVLVFFGTECPLARVYAPRLSALASEYSAAGVAFLGINAMEGDSFDDLARFAGEGGVRFPLFKDSDGAVAGQFGATRHLEVFVLDHERNVKYHGRVDDQYDSEIVRAEPARDDLKVALEELLSGNSEISIPETSVSTSLADATPRATAMIAVAPVWSDPDAEAVVDADEAPAAPADDSVSSSAGVSQQSAGTPSSPVDAPTATPVSPPQMTAIALALIFTIACWLVGRRRAQPQTVGRRG